MNEIRLLAVIGIPEWMAAGFVVLSFGMAFLSALLGWVMARRSLAGDRRMESELRQQLAAYESECATLRRAASDSGAAAAGAEGRRQAAEELAAVRTREGQEFQRQASALREQLAAVETERAGLRAEVDKGIALLAEQQRFHADNERELREKHDAALAELRQAGDRTVALLREQFKALAAEALAANNPEFLRLAGEKMAVFKAGADGDLSRRQEQIAGLVRPLEEQLRAYQHRLQQSESQQQASLGQMQEHLKLLAAQSEALSSETQRLRIVLSSNQARGRWGEETLRRVVEAAGLSAHCDFTEQSKEGDGKPDLVVRLPGDRVILVDAKVPDLAFLDAMGTADEVKRRAFLEAHARSLKETIRQLAQRKYPKAFSNALDFVVLFLPAESLFSAALEGDPELILWAAGEQILLATPASLIALLRSVAVSWQQHDLSINNRQIGATAAELLERVTVFVGHFEKIRKALAAASESYNEAVGSYERRVRPVGERLVRLSAKSEDQALPEIPALAIPLRSEPASRG